MPSEALKDTDTDLPATVTNRNPKHSLPGKETGRVRKRSRYVARACNRCKTQKVRCDGKLPCAQCASRTPDSCGYGPNQQLNPESNYGSQIYKGIPGGDQANEAGVEATVILSGRDAGSVAELPALVQRQNDKLDMLIERTNALDKLIAAKHRTIQPRGSTAREKSTATVDAVLHPSKPHLPLFRGPTSPSFCISVVDMDLRELERRVNGALTSSDAESAVSCTTFSILHGEFVDDDYSEVAESDAGGLNNYAPFAPVGNGDNSVSLRPLQEMDMNRIEHLLAVYGDMAGIMFPILDLSDLLCKARELHATMASYPSVWDSANLIYLQMDKNDVNILKMALAIALVAEGEGYSEMALALHQSLQRDVEAMAWSAEVDIKGLMLLTLVGQCHMFQDEWRLAWRVLGNVARIVLELGLNRQRVLMRSFPDNKKCTEAINTVWSIFVLDRQLSYALGLPITLQDLHIDGNFPAPVNAPYLKAMIEYACIGAQACDSLYSEKNAEQRGPNNCRELLGFFQYRVEQWQQNIPRELQFTYNDNSNKSIRLIRTILYLRANHLRIITTRPFLCSNAGLTPLNTNLWATAVNVACDTIQVLARLDSSSDIYRLQQAQFNYFLITALGVVLLAITREQLKPCPPLPGSSNQQQPQVPQTTYIKARRDALIALNLLRTLAESSRPSRRHWTRAASLGFRLNLLGILMQRPSVETDVDASDDMNELASQAQDLGGAGTGGTMAKTSGQQDDSDSMIPELQDMFMLEFNAVSQSAGLATTADLDMLLDGSSLGTNL